MRSQTAAKRANFSLRDDETLRTFIIRAMRCLKNRVPRHIDDLYHVVWDAVSETALRGYNEPDKFPTFGHALSYAYVALRRAAGRARETHIQHTVNLDEHPGNTRNSEAPVLLSQLLADLPDEHQQAVIATEVYGYSADDVAQMQGVAKPTAYNRKSKGMKELKKRAAESERPCSN